jgi:uncharacterized OB-fold protein
MRFLQKLVSKKQLEYDDTLGYITKEEMQKLREVAHPQRKHPKVNHRRYSCGRCGSRYFYKILACPQCESKRIEEAV